MARKQTVKDSELKAILAEVEQEIGSLLKTEREKLAKAHPGEETSSEPPKDASATKEASDSGSPEASDSGPPPPSGGPPPGPDASASPPADASASPPPPDGSAGPADASGDPAADTATDVDMLVGEYSKLTPEELKAHYLAAKTAVMSLLGGGADASAGSAPPPAAPPGPGMDASASPSAPPAMKMELDSIAPKGKVGDGQDHLAAVQPKGKVGDGEDRLAAIAPSKVTKDELDLNPAPKGENPGPPNGENPLKAAKSQTNDEINLLKSQIEEQNAVVDKLAQALTLVLTRPERKALTGVSYIAKSEPALKPAADMSKAEINERLNQVTRNPKLQKSDRELINAYCVGSIDVSKIEHLLTEK